MAFFYYSTEVEVILMTNFHIQWIKYKNNVLLSVTEVKNSGNVKRVSLTRSHRTVDTLVYSRGLQRKGAHFACFLDQVQPKSLFDDVINAWVFLFNSKDQQHH